MNINPHIRIGALVPTGNVVLEREFRRLSPRAVDVRVLGFSYPGVGGDFCADLAHTARAPLDELVAWGAQLIFFGCTAASMRCDAPEHHAALEAIAGVPVITAAQAVLAALAALRVRRLTVATPYGAAGNSLINEFLSAHNAEVAAIKGLEFDRSPEIWSARAPTLPPQELLDFSLSFDSPASQALFLPCTAVGSLDTIELFEQRTGKPAVSSVQAGFWASLQRLGVDGCQSGAGRLLRDWIDSPAVISASI